MMRSIRRVAGLAAVAAVALGAAATPVRAQEVMSKESVAELKAAYQGDLEVMRGKFVGLAEAFPQDRYAWRPMEGVRSVAEVLTLAAMEGYGFIPTTLGGKAGLSQEDSGKVRALTNKAEIIAQINKGFAHAKAQLEALDNASLTGRRAVMGQPRSAAAVVLMVSGDLHEHLGQLIAYARMNHIVPPWSQ